VPQDPARVSEFPTPFGRYTLTGLLGEGGMGRVFRAELVGPAGFRKELAIKLLRPEALDAREDFVREARLGGLLKHPNLVDVYEFDEHEGSLFLVMELVRGTSLHAAARQRATLPPLAVLQIARQVCVALSHAHGLRVDGHRAGLVHSDLKPGNILLGRDGLVKVADLGVAWAAGLFGALPADTLRGTLSWMAPEQILGEPVDHRADLFALGTIITTCVLGHHPFRRGNTPATATAVVDVEDTLAEHRIVEQLDAALPGLGAVVARCQRYRPDDRFPTAGALAAALTPLFRKAARTAGLAELLTDLLPDVAQDEFISMSAPPSGSIRGLDEHGATNLQPDTDAFFGRADELARLAALLDGGTRLVTLKAAGGAGKSRLARRFGAGRAEKLAGGTWFVPLVDARGADGVVHAVADALELHGVTDEDALLDALQQRGPTLLLLDNAEHLVEVLKPLLARWLSEASALRVLVTSRRPFELPAEQVLELGPLQEAEAVALFRERAVRTRPGWEPSPDDIDQLPELVRRLDGLPLAIELAAARAGSLPVRELVARLGERFRLLVDRHAEDPRQAALATTLSWSWDQLQPWEQAALGQLTVFVGGFTLDEAELVLSLSAWADAGWAVDVVGELARQSMLTSRAVEGRPRFAMFESIRDWAARHQRPEDLAGARDRHAAAYARLGTDHAIEALRRRGGGSRRRRLVAELENLVVACERAVDRADVPTAVNCCVAVLHALDVAGPAVVAENLAARVAAFDDLSDRDRARVLIASGWVRRRGSFASAARRLDLARQLAEDCGDAKLELSARLFRAAVGIGRGTDATEPEVFEGLAEEHEDRGDLGGAGLARTLAGVVHYHQGRLKESRQALEDSLDLIGDHADRGSELFARIGLGTTLMGMGNLDAAEREYTRCLKLARSIGERFREGVILGNLGVLAMTARNLPPARRYLRESGAIHRQVGARAQEGICLLNLGQILLDEGRTREARANLERAVQLCRRTWPLGAGSAEAVLAVIDAREGQHDAAEQHFCAALEHLGNGVDRVEEGKAWAWGAEVAWRGGEQARAQERLAKATALLEELGAEPSSDLAVLIEDVRGRVEG